MMEIVKGLETYENEMGVPREIVDLGEKAQMVMYNYLVGVEGESGNSRGDIVKSYMMAEEGWAEIEERLFISDEGVMKKRDPMLYAKWAMEATRYWNAKGLDKHIENFEKVLLGGVSKEKMLKDAMWRDAMSAEDLAYRMQNRREYVKVSGMAQQNNNVVFNVYKRGGGEEKAKAIKSELGIDRFDLSDVIEDE
jgi:DNA-binding PadR family transcriptional regulator